MTKEQEKAIDDLKFFNQGEYITKEMEESAKIVLEMLEKQDNIIESKNRLLRIIGRELHQAETELEKKKKMIDLMAQDKYENVDMYQMADIGYEIGYDLAKLFSGIPDEEVLNIIKQYFEGRAKGDEK